MRSLSYRFFNSRGYETRLRYVFYSTSLVSLRDNSVNRHRCIRLQYDCVADALRSRPTALQYDWFEASARLQSYFCCLYLHATATARHTTARRVSMRLSAFVICASHLHLRQLLRLHSRRVCPAACRRRLIATRTASSFCASVSSSAQRATVIARDDAACGSKASTASTTCGVLRHTLLLARCVRPCRRYCDSARLQRFQHFGASSNFRAT